MTFQIRRRTPGLIFVVALLLLLIPVVNAPAAEPPEYIVGIVPQQSASRLARNWTPILQYLASHTGYRFRFETAADIPTFEQRLDAGRYDFAYMNPLHYIVFHSAAGYEALLAERNRRLKGIVVVQKDSPYQQISELQDQKLAFPSPAAFAASVLPRRFLQKDGVEHEPAYVSSHDSVYLTVSQGLYVAGGGIVRTFNNLDPQVRDQLRILWKTPGVAPHPIAVHPRVPAPVAEAFREAVISMTNDHTGFALLEAAGFGAFSSADDGDYDPIRQLDIHLLDHYLKE